MVWPLAGSLDKDMIETVIFAKAPPIPPGGKFFPLENTFCLKQSVYKVFEKF